MNLVALMFFYHFDEILLVLYFWTEVRSNVLSIAMQTPVFIISIVWHTADFPSLVPCLSKTDVLVLVEDVDFIFKT